MRFSLSPLWKALAAKPTYSSMREHASFSNPLPFIGESVLTKMTFDNPRNQTAAVRAFLEEGGEKKKHRGKRSSLHSQLSSHLPPSLSQLLHTDTHTHTESFLEASSSPASSSAARQELLLTLPSEKGDFFFFTEEDRREKE